MHFRITKKKPRAAAFPSSLWCINTIDVLRRLPFYRACVRVFVCVCVRERVSGSVCVGHSWQEGWRTSSLLNEAFEDNDIPSGGL